MATLRTIPGNTALVRAEHFNSIAAAFAELKAATGIQPRVLGISEVSDGIPGGARTLAEARRAGSGTSSDHYEDNARGYAAVDIDNQRALRNALGSARFEAILAKYGWRNVQINGAPFPSEPWHFARQVTVGTAPSSSVLPLVVDGDWGPKTTRALQAALGVTVDGDFGPQSTRALQAKLGVTVDGDFGPQSKRALQRYLGVDADGDIGPITVRALQTRLNAGTF